MPRVLSAIWILVIGIFVLATQVDCSAQLQPMYFGVPESNPNKFLKLLPGDKTHRNARLEIFDLSGEAFVRISTFELPQTRRPYEIVVSPDGRFIVGIGNFIALPKKNGAVTLVDLKKNIVKEICTRRSLH